MIEKAISLLIGTLAVAAATGVWYWAIPIRPFNLSGAPGRMPVKAAGSFRWKRDEKP